MKTKIKTKDMFELSDGNLEVLINIPKMMKISKYRNQLRKLTIDYLYEGYGKNIDKRLEGIKKGGNNEKI
jgi:hypothetical protein